MTGGHRRDSGAAGVEPSTVRRLLRWGRDAALTAGAVVGALCFVVMIVCALLDIRPLVFLSGSMRPTIDAGALAFAQKTPTAELRKGDIVSVLTDKGSRVTHRIVAIDRSGVSPALHLKGDANPVEDEKPYIVDSADRVLFSVPYVGHGVAFISSPQGLFLLGVGVTGLLVFAFRPGLRRRGTRAVALGIVPLVAALSIPQATTSTFAWFTDNGTVTSAAATHNVVSPTSASCSAALLTATVSWTADPRYDYEVILRRVTAPSSIISTQQITGANSSVTYTGLTSFGTPGLGTFDYQVEIRSYLANTTTWRAANAHTYQYLRLAALIVGATVSCTNTSGT
jgi:signal peptidase